MSELRSVVEDLRSQVPSSLPDARIEDDFAELHAAAEAIEAERLRRLAEVDRRRLFERDGHLSAASWLAGRFRVGWGVARQGVCLARNLSAMDGVRQSFEGGAISLSAVRVLAEVRDLEPEAFARAEQTLVEAAERHSIGDLRRVAIHWRHVVERDRAEAGDDVLRARRRLHASVTLSGTVRVDGYLDPETGEHS